MTSALSPYAGSLLPSAAHTHRNPMDPQDKLEAALASFARYYMGNDDPEGLASDLLIILSEIVYIDAIAKPLAQALDDEVQVNQRLDGEEEEEEPDWLTDPNSRMARCHY